MSPSPSLSLTCPAGCGSAPRTRHPIGGIGFGDRPNKRDKVTSRQLEKCTVNDDVTLTPDAKTNAQQAHRIPASCMFRLRQRTGALRTRLWCPDRLRAICGSSHLWFTSSIFTLLPCQVVAIGGELATSKRPLEWYQWRVLKSQAG
ncbi:unnamed protein product [Protopolystoma xenopodis]|uniref:Uncharacterized protein n=1 Tax=Protopolystoma xenopodis TaxID=117903 RepID=A0A3S5A2Z9_9PLAT|nr:unnamed protein product [Protopolystoma xenopodis]